MAPQNVRLSENPVRRRAKRALRGLFEIGQRAGLNVVPHHFYSHYPTIAELRREEHWRQPSSMAGIAGLEVADQLAFLREVCDPEVMRRATDSDVFGEACRRNGEHGYGPVEALVLYCYMAWARPPRVVQVGCGVATAVMLQAKRDFGLDTTVVCVEPFPTQYLQDAAARSEIELHACPAQKVDLDVLTGIGPGGLLFVDSTHTVKPGSEVNRLVLEVLPRLPAGGRVHYHDIWFPYDYTPGVLTTELFFWAEATLVQAYLVDNRRARVRAALSTLHYWAPDDLRALVPSYRPIQHEHGYATTWPASGDSAAGHFPSSMYFEIAGDPT